MVFFSADKAFRGMRMFLISEYRQKTLLRMYMADNGVLIPRDLLADIAPRPV